MSELIPTKHLQIRFKFHDVLILLVAAALIGWCMLVLPSINIGDDIRYLVIAGVSFLLIEGVIRMVIFKILRIKSKDDFSQLPQFIVTEYINVNKNTLSKIFLIPNIVYCLFSQACLFLVIQMALRFQRHILKMLSCLR